MENDVGELDFRALEATRELGSRGLWVLAGELVWVLGDGGNGEVGSFGEVEFGAGEVEEWGEGGLS